MKITRSEKWNLITNNNDKEFLDLTIMEYRRYVRALSIIFMSEWSSFSSCDSHKIKKVMEEKIHPTKKRPDVKISYFQNSFKKFPSYLRRVAIMDAYGQTKSFLSRYNKWLDGERRHQNEKPPRFQAKTNTYPSLYKGQCIKYHSNFTKAEIKVWNGSDWVWITVELQNNGKRVHDVANKLLSPLLCKIGKEWILSIPFEKNVKLIEDKKSTIVCAVDLGINTQASVSIVKNDGTVLARKFIHRGRDKDRIRQRLDKIRKSAKLTGKLSKGFSKGWYRKAYNIAENSAHLVSREIVEFAKKHGAERLVFEYMKHFRPKAKGSKLKAKFHLWEHRRIMEFSCNKWWESGGRIAFVSPRNTSKLAFDGSGIVKRDKDNYALCVFPNGKRYNADLNASYNIAAKYFLRDSDISKASGGRSSSTGSENSPKRANDITLSMLWVKVA